VPGKGPASGREDLASAAATDIDLSALNSENLLVFDFDRQVFPTRGRRAGSVIDRLSHSLLALWQRAETQDP